jgi:hypothetical protein
MKRAVRSSLYCFALSGVLGAFAGAACDSGDDSSSNPPVDNDASSPSGDSGSPVTTTPDSGSPVQSVDAGHEAAADSATGADSSSSVDASPDAADAADAAVSTYCASQAGLAFCADFDETNAIQSDAGAQTFDQVVSNGTELSISNAQSVSAPSSLFLNLGTPATGDQSAKVVKQVTPALGVTQAVYEFDLYIDSLPPAGNGGFVTDFQFSDTQGNGSPGQDQFGFRIAVFSTSTGAFDHADFEHNAPALNPAPPDDVTSPFPITAGQWNHVKIAVAYTATGFDGGNGVSVQAYTNGSTTAAVDKQYPAPFAAAPFARLALGMVYAFSNSANQYGIYYDNVTLKLQ